MRPARKASVGFTLLELLISVAILGLIATMAVPAYDRHVAIGRQAQAKTWLTLAYTQESIFFTELNTYTNCLRKIGVDPTDQKALWYTFGFSTASGYTAVPACGPNSDSSSCLAYTFDISGNTVSTCGAGGVGDNQTNFYSNMCVNSTYSSASNCHISHNSDVTNFPTRYTFTARANGNITSKANYDQWQIDHNKVLVNFIPGI